MPKPCILKVLEHLQYLITHHLQSVWLTLRNNPKRTLIVQTKALSGSLTILHLLCNLMGINLQWCSTVRTVYITYLLQGTLSPLLQSLDATQLSAHFVLIAIWKGFGWVPMFIVATYWVCKNNLNFKKLQN